MHSLQFWKSWPSTYQRIGLVAGGAFIFSLLFLWFAYLKSPEPALQWLHIQERELEEIPVHTFQHGLLELTVSGDNFLIFERMLGDNLKPNLPASYIFLAALSMCMIFMVSIITAMSRFWYILGMGLFILFIVGFRLEIIEVWGLQNKSFTVFTLVAYLIPSFYFHFFNKSVSFTWRLLVFLFITIALGVLIILFSKVDYPLLHLSVTGITAATVISIVFIFMIAHEILASFVFIASQATREGKSLNHFLIISSIYMINLALAYAHKIGMIDWNFMYVDFYLLLSVSGILGIWGFRMRQPQYEGILEADPFGVYFFLMLGVLSFTTIGYFISTANDPALATVEDAIIYGHLGFGIIFLTYVISNFIGMLATNLPVYKVLYKPNSMPYFTFRFGGIIATLAFVFYNTWQVPVQNAFAGYYNAGGDLYTTLNNRRFAEAFYQRASEYGFLNHHSNYAIANIEGERFNSVKERNYYNRASERKPTEHSYLNLSQTFQREGRWLDALLALREAKRDFPDSGPIANTLGLVYGKINVIDSSLYFLSQAMESGITKNEAETNFIGIAAKSNLTVSADSLYQLSESENKGTKSNALAFANKQGERIELEIDLQQDTLLNLFSASLISNYLLNHIGETDSSFISKVISLARKPANRDYKETLLFSSALALYADAQIGKAFSLLEEVTAFSSKAGRYNTVLAMWALEQRDPENAALFTQFALQQQNEETLLVSAIAQTQIRNFETALVQWDTLKRTSDSTMAVFAEKMIRALTVNPGLAQQLTDEEKYLFVQYRLKPTDTLELNRLLTTMEDQDLKARAILESSQKFFELDETKAAIDQFQKIKGLKLSDRELFDQINHFELDLLAKRGNFRLLAQQINNQNITFPVRWKNQQLYLRTLLAESSGDTTRLDEQYRWLSQSNPFHEDAIMASARYIEQKKGQLEGYSVLAEALHMNPYSPKLLKAYSLSAAQLGFTEYAASALERLKPLITQDALRNFLSEHSQDFGALLQ